MAKRKPEPSPAADPPPAKPEYTVVARRYRPQQFDELIGQEAVAGLLTNALQSGRVAHAYLFTGARGVGKTSSARILAKALNCLEGPTPRPCGHCDICSGIATGDDVDVLEIDAASNRGIDEVREIRQNVQFRPARARFKIYIIDEVHMLTGPAFNALLKTLEEPPAGVKFILATTEVHKIPVTILSRCQRFDFRNIASPQIARHLKSIVAQEKLIADDGALDLIARRAAGSMRDAESLLDQLLAFGERLTPDLVHRLVGTASAERVIGIADAVFAGDAAKAVALTHQSLQEGAHVSELIDQLVELWRDLMLIASCGESAIVSDAVPAVRELAKRASLDALLCGLDILSHAKSRLKFTNLGSVLLEMAVIRLARLDQLISIADVLSRTQSSAPALSASHPQRTALPDAEEKKVEPVVVASLTPQSLPAHWPEICRGVGPMLASDLEKAKSVAIFAPNQLVIHFLQGYNQAYQNCTDPGRQQRIRDAVHRLTGETWTIRVELVNDPHAVNGAPVTADAASAARPAGSLPLVENLIAALDARLLRTDTGFGALAESAAEPDSAPDEWTGPAEEE